jgi:serine/threonine-protein kinase
VTGDSAESASGRLIGMLVKDRYRIERQLGRGGFASTYLASDTQLHSRSVVLKALHDFQAEDPWARRKFRQEAEALARINHPGVVGPLDFGELPDGRPFLVMQFIDGIPLRKAIDPQGMEFARAASILRQVGRALTAAHDQGICHRDIKPDNIMLESPATEDEQAKLIDFGIAKLADSQVTVTQTTQIAGSMGYIPPELFNGKPYTAASDVYSFGVVAYQMLTGARPFKSDSQAQLIRMQLEGDCPAPRVLRPEIPVEAESCILKAIAVSPDDRYSRPRDFGDALSRSLTSLPVPKPAPAPPPPDMPTVPYVPSAPIAPPPLATLRPQPSRLPATRWIVGIAAIGLVAGGAVLYFANRKPTPVIPSNAPAQQPVAENKRPEPPPPDAGSAPRPRFGLKYVDIPAGAGMIGPPESPATFTTPGFELGATEVTVEAYLAYTRSAGLPVPSPPRIAGKVFNADWQDGKLPMVMVTWIDANLFCNASRGRLPTEAEWEYAARAGSSGDTYGPPEEIAWFVNNSGPQTIDGQRLWNVETHKVWTSYEKRVVEEGVAPHPVGQKTPNAFGLYDMLGSVVEWTASDFKPDGPEKVVRGGAWAFIGPMRVWQRDRYNPMTNNGYLGFRCLIPK